MNQSPHPIRSVFAVGLVATILSYVGCARTFETTEGPSEVVKQTTPKGPEEASAATVLPTGIAASPDVKKDEEVAPASATSPADVAKSLVATPDSSHDRPDPGGDPLKLFAAWNSKPPAAVLVISGEQNGYLQPCGCTDGQLGGVGRRFDLIEKLKAKGWPVAGLDLGNLIHDPAGARGGPEQEKIKFDIAIKALAAMKYRAIGIGPEDLKLGINEFLGILINPKGPQFLSANLQPIAGFEAAIQPSLVFQAGPVSVGVTSVIDPESFRALADPDKGELLTLKEPAEALKPVVAAMASKAKVKVLMVEGPPELATTLARTFPQFDLVVTRSKFDDPDARPESLNGGKTLLINVGRKGKYAGVVGLFPGSSPSVDFHLQPLEGPTFKEAEPMRALVDDEFVSVLRSVGVVENFMRTANTAYPAGATYVGAVSCQSCHPNTFAKWASTKHANAYEALTDPKRNREADAECISCHTTGFGYKTGWVSAEKTPLLKGNQCENCHGPASLHVANPDNLAFRTPMAMTAESADRSGFCIKCHNDDNDHNFTFDARYAQIVHKGLDTYDDPKVHKPQPSRPASTAPATGLSP